MKNWICPRCNSVNGGAHKFCSECGQPVPVMSRPEFCCEASWREAKQLAWNQRDLTCGCDHNESCTRCFPLDFRHGGKWAQYK